MQTLAEIQATASRKIADMLNSNHVKPESGAPQLLSHEGVSVSWSRAAQRWVAA
jgi:hypothetical protein